MSQYPTATPVLPQPGAFLGDFHDDRVSMLGFVPLDAPAGSQMRAIHLLAGETLQSDTQDFWILQVGRLQNGAFFVVGPDISLARGLPGGLVQTITFLFPALFTKGDFVGVRLKQTGAPAPLIGLSVVPEYGILSTSVTASK